MAQPTQPTRWLDRQAVKSSVRQSLNGHVFACFLVCIIPAILPWVMQLIPTAGATVNLLLADTYVLSVSPWMLALSLLASTFVTDPMAVGVAGFFLRLRRDPEHLPSPITVCDCFGAGYWPLMGAMLLRSLRMALWAAVPLGLGLLLPGALTRETVIAAQGPMQVLRVGGSLPIFAAVAAVAWLYRSVVYMLVPYVLSDNPGLPPVEALRAGREKTRGRLRELIVLQFSFFGWILFISVTFFIGAVYAYPYIEATIAAYYALYAQPEPSAPADADA